MIASALRWLYPERCALCRVIGEPIVCPRCQGEMTFAEGVRPDVSPLSYRRAIYRYEGRAAQAVKRLKYSNSTGLVSFMAEALAPSIAELASEDDLVVPVPIHRRRHAERGFNQSRLLCEGSHQRVVEPNALSRVRFAPPQASLPVSARYDNIEGAFRASSIVVGKRILLVDDVLTSGHTARACAAALLEAGATEVGILTFAAGGRLS